MEFKKGDFVICKPGFENTDDKIIGGGTGYKPGRVFKIFNISGSGKDRWVLWPDNGTEYSENYGIFHTAVEKHMNVEMVEQIILKEIYG
jgi:hypothetical protein